MCTHSVRDPHYHGKRRVHGHSTPRNSSLSARPCSSFTTKRIPSLGVGFFASLSFFRFIRIYLISTAPSHTTPHRRRLRNVKRIMSFLSLDRFKYTPLKRPALDGGDSTEKLLDNPDQIQQAISRPTGLKAAIALTLWTLAAVIAGAWISRTWSYPKPSGIELKSLEFGILSS